jgi:hypothetical protein
MNLREGTRRLALLLGVVGAIFGGFVSYFQLQSTMRQRADHQQFEQLASSQIVQDARNCLKGVLSERGCDEEKTDRWDDYRVSPFFPDSKAISLPGGRIRDYPKSMSEEQMEKVLQKEFPPGSTDVRQEQPTRATWETFPPYAVNQGGIKIVHWDSNLGIASIETEGGKTLYPTPAPAWWTYLLIAFFPIVGFFIPWGAVRAIGWVGAGFAESSK